MSTHGASDRSPHCSSVPVTSGNSTVDPAVTRHGGRGTSQTQLREPRGIRCQQTCSDLASHDQQATDQGTLAHGLGCHVQPVHASSSTVKPC